MYLTNATVNNDEIGHGPFSMIETAAEHFRKTAGVIIDIAAHFKYSILAFVRLTVFDDRHNADIFTAAEVGHIVSFDAKDVQLFIQIFKAGINTIFLNERNILD